MYRVNKSYGESSSDDEGPSLPKEQRMYIDDDAMKNNKAGRYYLLDFTCRNIFILRDFFCKNCLTPILSKAAQMWADLLAEQSLAETFSDKVGVHRGGNDMVERGVESYILPDVRYTSNDPEMKQQMVILICEFVQKL